MKAVSHQLQTRRPRPKPTVTAAWRERYRQGTLRARGSPSLEIVAKQPFIALNCAAIPEGLVENELFGHERGARFTGAGNRKAGKIEMAQRGTLFLDEIGELPSRQPGQAFLRVSRRNALFRTSGAARNPSKVDVRIIVATNRDLLAGPRPGEVFFSRRSVLSESSAVPLTIPPLRERGGDPRFCSPQHFLEQFGRRIRQGPTLPQR